MILYSFLTAPEEASQCFGGSMENPSVGPLGYDVSQA